MAKSEFFLRYADLAITFTTESTVRIVRQSSAQNIEISLSEWGFLLAASDLCGWPIVSPIEHNDTVKRAQAMAEESDLQ